MKVHWQRIKDSPPQVQDSEVEKVLAHNPPSIEMTELAFPMCWRFVGAAAFGGHFASRDAEPHANSCLCSILNANEMSYMISTAIAKG